MDEPAASEDVSPVGSLPPEQGPTNQGASEKSAEPSHPQKSPEDRLGSEPLPPVGTVPSIPSPQRAELNPREGQFPVPEALRPGESAIKEIRKPASLQEEPDNLAGEAGQPRQEEIQPTSRQSTIHNETFPLTRSLYELYARRFRFRQSISRQKSRAKPEAKG